MMVVGCWIKNLLATTLSFLWDLDEPVVCGSTKIVKKIKVLLLLCTLVMVIFGGSYCLMAERLSHQILG